MAAKNNRGGAIAPPDPWDPLIRITHWGVAAAVLANYLLTKPGGSVHVWIGWIVLALLALRFAWGFVGPREARFSAFLPNPRAAVSHLANLRRGRVREHASHNPAGALMIYALWGCLVVITLTGLVMTEGKSPITIAEEQAAVAAGDWSVLVKDGEGHEGGEDESIVKDVHEVAANLILFLALIHVLGVAVEGRALRRNLVWPMIARRGKRG